VTAMLIRAAMYDYDVEQRCVTTMLIRAAMCDRDVDKNSDV